LEAKVCSLSFFFPSHLESINHAFCIWLAVIIPVL
jgi:hypothetical protein